MFAKILVLECVTNLHVGNGDVNYNIIDNEVEKDPVTNYPTINSSGVKGSIREFFESKKVDESDIKDWLGAEGMDEGGKKKSSSAGKIKILSAEFVSRPFRASEGPKAYYMITTPETIKRVNDLSNTFIGRGLFGEVKQNSTTQCAAEGEPISDSVLFGNSEYYVIKDSKFRENQLPVMARNKLENGVSKNLWYEEIVPHGSIFIVPVLCEDKNMLNKFVNELSGKIVQFGGNASIGYGLCKVSVEEPKNE